METLNVLLQYLCVTLSKETGFALDHLRIIIKKVIEREKIPSLPSEKVTQHAEAKKIIFNQACFELWRNSGVIEKLLTLTRAAVEKAPKPEDRKNIKDKLLSFLRTQPTKMSDERAMLIAQYLEKLGFDAYPDDLEAYKRDIANRNPETVINNPNIYFEIKDLPSAEKAFADEVLVKVLNTKSMEDLKVVYNSIAMTPGSKVSLQDFRNLIASTDVFKKQRAQLEMLRPVPKPGAPAGAPGSVGAGAGGPTTPQQIQMQQQMHQQVQLYTQQQKQQQLQLQQLQMQDPQQQQAAQPQAKAPGTLSRVAYPPLQHPAKPQPPVPAGVAPGSAVSAQLQQVVLQPQVPHQQLQHPHFQQQHIQQVQMVQAMQQGQGLGAGIPPSQVQQQQQLQQKLQQQQQQQLQLQQQQQQQQQQQKLQQQQQQPSLGDAAPQGQGVKRPAPGAPSSTIEGPALKIPAVAGGGDRPAALQSVRPSNPSNPTDSLQPTLGAPLHSPTHAPMRFPESKETSEQQVQAPPTLSLEEKKQLLEKQLSDQGGLGAKLMRHAWSTAVQEKRGNALTMRSGIVPVENAARYAYLLKDGKM